MVSVHQLLYPLGPQPTICIGQLQIWSRHQAESKSLLLLGIHSLDMQPMSDSPAQSTILSLIKMSPIVTCCLMDMTKLQCTISHTPFDQPTPALTDLPFQTSKTITSNCFQIICV